MEHRDRSHGRGSEGNRYLLLAALDPPAQPTTLAPGLTLLSAPAVGEDFPDVDFENGHFMDVMPFMNASFCEVESAMDSAISPGLDTEKRALLASQLLTLMNFSAQFPVAIAQKSWGRIEEDRQTYQRQLRKTIQSRLRDAGTPGV